MTLSERFRHLREKWCLSQADMATRVGVTRNSWQRYERGELPNGETLMRLAALGSNVQWLLTGIGPVMTGQDGAVPAVAARDQDAVLDYLRAENARLVVSLAELTAALQREQAKRRALLVEAGPLLAGCIAAVEQVKRQQLPEMSPQQAADLILSMLGQLLPPLRADDGEGASP